MPPAWRQETEHQGQGLVLPAQAGRRDLARGGPVDAQRPRPQLPAAPTAASLVTELAQHMAILLDVPAPLARAPRHFLLHWLLMLERIRRLLPDDD